MRQYPLFLDDEEVGTVRVSREGMYCRITCVCNKAHLYDCSITVTTEDCCNDLGKCIKGSDGYALRRFVPAKILGSGEPYFSVRHAQGSETEIIPLDPDRPFLMIAQLPHARLVVGKSGVGLVFKS